MPGKLVNLFCRKKKDISDNEMQSILNRHLKLWSLKVDEKYSPYLGFLWFPDLNLLIYIQILEIPKGCLNV